MVVALAALALIAVVAIGALYGVLRAEQNHRRTEGAAWERERQLFRQELQLLITRIVDPPAGTAMSIPFIEEGENPSMSLSEEFPTDSEWEKLAGRGEPDRALT